METALRALVDIDETDVARLDELAARTKRSRAALIREAVGDYLAKNRQQIIADGFGLWGDHEIDGLEHQRKMRSEW